jgi:hypothetical protein
VPQAPNWSAPITASLNGLPPVAAPSYSVKAPPAKQPTDEHASAAVDELEAWRKIAVRRWLSGRIA